MYIQLPGNEAKEIRRFSLSANEVPSLVRVKVGPADAGFPLKIRALVKKTEGEEVVAREISSTVPSFTVLLKEPGSFRLSLENLDSIERTITCEIECSKVERVLSTEYYAIKSLGPRALLVTDGSKLFVLKSLERVWHLIRNEYFSGIFAWFFLSSILQTGIPKLLHFDAERKYILYEFIEGESLDVIINRNKRSLPTVRQILTALRDASAILDVASQHGIIHRDLKPQHIILSKEKTYIIDWELACRLGDCRLPVGLATYASPEALTGKYHERSDVCSFAKLIAVSLGIWYVLEGGTIVQPLEPGLDIPPAVLDELKELIRRAVSGKAEDRPSFKELREGLDRAIKACSDAET